MAVFNLMCENFKTNIFCKQPSMDDCEAKNLLRSSSKTFFIESRKPFIAEYFIKPPAEIQVIFPCKINIEKICIDTKVGSQMSTGFKIDINREQKSQTKTFFLASDLSKHILCFKNKMFTCDAKYHQLDQMHSNFNFNESDKISEIELRYSKHLDYVDSITVTITKVNRASACVIKSMEIWGQPSKSVPSDILTTFLEQYTEITSKKSFLCKEMSECTPENNTLDSITSNSDIPEDYLDEITQELLCLPMLLPSGHIVDISTIEKHNEMESHWGRSPSDRLQGFRLQNFSILNLISHLNADLMTTF